MSDNVVTVPFMAQNQPNPAHLGNILIRYTYFDYRTKSRVNASYRMWAESPQAATKRFLDRPTAHNKMFIVDSAEVVK